MMLSGTIATETLELLWYNYLTLGENVDTGSMPPEILASHVARNSPVRPFRIAAWLGRQAFFMAAWSLWERYAREVCDDLPMKTSRGKGESHVDWVHGTMSANDLCFADYEWFKNANSLRNLLTHYGGRAVGSRPQTLLKRGLKAFPDLELYRDGYTAIDHGHIADLELKIEFFIKETSLQH
jgi:hypothetical protein